MVGMTRLLRELARPANDADYLVGAACLLALAAILACV